MPASRFAAWAGAPTAERVTRVIRVTERPHLSFPAALEAVSGVTRVAEPEVTRVTAPRPNMMEVTQVTQGTRPGLPRKPAAYQCRNPGNLGNPQEGQCAASGDAAANPIWWRTFIEQRAAIRQLNSGRPRDEAEMLAFSDTVLEWHHRCGAHCDPRRCPACGDEFRGEEGLILCDGARVHLGGARGVNCLIAYGQKWRGAALTGLRVLGVSPSEGFTLL